MAEAAQLDAVELARQAFRDLLAADRTLTVAALAGRVGINDLTLARFVADGSEVVPRPHVWALIKKWMQDQSKQTSSYRTHVAESAPAYGSTAANPAVFYAGVAAGMAQAVRRSLVSAVEEQDRLIKHLEGLPSVLDRMAASEDVPVASSALDVSAAALQQRAEPLKADAHVRPFLTNEEIDADIAAHDELLDKVAAGKRAAKKAPKNQKRAAG